MSLKEKFAPCPTAQEIVAEARVAEAAGRRTLTDALEYILEDECAPDKLQREVFDLVAEDIARERTEEA